FIFFAAIFWFLAGWLVLVPIGALVLFVVPGILAQRRLRAYATEAMRESSLRNGMLVEAVQGIEDIKTLQAEEHFQRRWNHYTAVASEAQLKLRGLSNRDRKSTRLNSSHVKISYAVFCLKKKRSNTNVNH